MTAKIVNLRTARKRKTWLKKEIIAEENRHAFGQPAHQRRAAEAEKEKLLRFIEAHRRETNFDK